MKQILIDSSSIMLMYAIANVRPLISGADSCIRTCFAAFEASLALRLRSGQRGLLRASIGCVAAGACGF